MSLLASPLPQAFCFALHDNDGFGGYQCFTSLNIMTLKAPW